MVSSFCVFELCCKFSKLDYSIMRGCLCLPMDASRLQKMSSWFVIAVCLAFLCCHCRAQIEKYDAEEDVTLEQVTTLDDKVYVGGKNWLYLLDGELNVLEHKSTGPVMMDSPKCNPAESCDDGLQTDNHAKVLEVDPDTEQLLVCGSVRQGLCSVYATKNEGDLEWGTEVELSTSNQLNYLGGRDTVFAFFGHSKITRSGNSVLYVGHSHDDRPLSIAQPAITARRLRQNHAGQFNISYLYENHSLGIHTAIDIDRVYKESYKVRYIYGFEHDGFSYFLTVQREHVGLSSKYVTRLVRVCQSDHGFYSYTEVEITCRKRNGVTTFYNIAQAAFAGAIGKEMKDKFMIEDDVTALYVVFGKSDVGSPESNPEDGSGLCIYTMDKVRRAFTSAQKDCYLQRGTLLPWIIHTEPDCKYEVCYTYNRYHLKLKYM